MYIRISQPAMLTQGEAGFTGCKYEDLVKAGVIAYIDHLFAMEEPPKGEISLSKTSVKAVRDGNVQKTPDITLSGDHRNYISVNVPKDIAIYNKTKGNFCREWYVEDLWR